MTKKSKMKNKMMNARGNLLIKVKMIWKRSMMMSKLIKDI